MEEVVNDDRLLCLSKHMPIMEQWPSLMTAIAECQVAEPLTATAKPWHRTITSSSPSAFFLAHTHTHTRTSAHRQTFFSRIGCVLLCFVVFVDVRVAFIIIYINIIIVIYLYYDYFAYMAKHKQSIVSKHQRPIAFIVIAVIHFVLVFVCI